MNPARWRAIFNKHMAPAGCHIARGDPPGNKIEAPRSPACNEEAAYRAAAKAPRGSDHHGVPALPLQEASDRGHTVGKDSGFHDDGDVVRRVGEPG
ncbi:MAG: hypothetical protein GY772_30590 [bacterium]|nr:hypothetical protein [bacterium]